MARILTPTDGRWYDELKAVAYYGETELETWIHQHAKSLFPYHYVIPFKKEVASKTTAKTKKPDLALIRNDFSAWVMVEVELEDHQLDHVLKQTRVFLDGDYNLPEIAQYVRDQFQKFHHKHVSLHRLKTLFNASPPAVLVIADEHADDWHRELRKLGVNYCIFEIYKNVTGNHIYRIFGEYPTVYAEEAHCRPHAQLPNLIEVIGPFTFTRVGRDGVVDVAYNDQITKWRFFEESGKQYLRFIGKSPPLPLSPSDTYGLFRDKSNKYSFKRS